MAILKILTLSCSPSKGRNSDTMLDHFILGIKEVKGVEVEKVYLEDIPVNLYNYSNGTGPEENEVEFKKLCQSISSEISGLVIATPTYNFSVPAHLKNFIDRIRFITLDLSNKNKLGQPKGKLGHLKTYFLVSCGTPDWAEKILFFTFPAFWLRGLFLYFNAKVIGALYSGDVETYKNQKVLKKCFKRGKRYAKKVLYSKDQGLLEKIFWRPPQI